MDDYLTRRGRRVDALFGFRRENVLALIVPRLFHEGVRLDADAGGVVRCRLGGRPAALVQVTEELHLDVSLLVAGWPRWMGELVARVGEETARAMVALPPIVAPLRTGSELTELILEHQIHAKDLHLLGERHAAARRLEGEPRFELAFERGTLELAYTEEAYAEAQESDDEAGFIAPELAVTVRWKGAPIALPDRELAWDDAELAELAVVGSMMVEGQPEALVRLLEAALPADTGALAADLELGSVLNVFGVALRRVGRLDDAVRTLARAMPIAERADPRLEQQVAYNLGYAKLERTMKERYHVGATEDGGLYTAHYDIDERHRDTWAECLVLFEGALALDPTDPAARSQVEHTRALLALLDGAPPRGAQVEHTGALLVPLDGAPPRGATPRAKPRDEASKGLPEWVRPVGVMLLLIVAFVVYMEATERPESEAGAPAAFEPRRAAPEPSGPDPRDAARVAAFERFDLEALPGPSTAACPIDVALPREVPRGEVLAPRLARAIGTGELYGTEYFDATVRYYATRYAPDVEVRPASPEGVGPVKGAGVDRADPLAFMRPAHRTTLLVTAWRDPVILEGGESMVPGWIAARLLVWSYEESRFVCASEVEAENRAGLSIVRASTYDPLADEDDPLNRARLDLVEQALRTGVPRLMATADPASPPPDPALQR